jgi:hypothetical protein
MFESGFAITFIAASSIDTTQQWEKKTVWQTILKAKQGKR